MLFLLLSKHSFLLNSFHIKIPMIIWYPSDVCPPKQLSNVMTFFSLCFNYFFLIILLLLLYIFINTTPVLHHAFWIMLNYNFLLVSLDFNIFVRFLSTLAHITAFFDYLELDLDSDFKHDSKMRCSPLLISGD